MSKKTPRTESTRDPAWEAAIDQAATISPELQNKATQMYDYYKNHSDGSQDVHPSFLKRVKRKFFTRKLKFYAILNDAGEIVTILAHQKNLVDAFLSLFYQKCSSHYILWCEQHDFIKSSKERQLILKAAHTSPLWKTYMDTRAEDFASFVRTFTLKKMIYDTEAAASLLRMFNHCAPLNIPGEKTIERLYYDFDEEVKDSFADDLDVLKNFFGELQGESDDSKKHSA